MKVGKTMEILVMIAALGVWIAASVHQSGKAKEADVPALVDLRGRTRAQLEQAFRSAGFARSGEWQEDADDVHAFFRPTSGWKTITADYGVEVSIKDDQVHASLANGGVYSRTYLFGFIPSGPKMPAGGEHFVKVKRVLEGRA
jgi:hypothetical protein